MGLSYLDVSRGAVCYSSAFIRLWGADVSVLADEQAEIGAVYRAVVIEVGRRIVRIYADHAGDAGLTLRIDDAAIRSLADDVIGAFGGDIAIAPRQFFRRLISTLGKAKQYPAYEPKTDRIDRATLGREAGLADPELEALGESRIVMPLDL